jgi:hypothetical protein
MPIKKIYQVLTKSNIWLNVILAAITTILYLAVLNNGFSVLDDPWMLVKNKQVFSLEPANITAYFTSFYYGQYSPLNTLVYGVIYALFGLSPFWYHSFSLILHVFNVLLVFWFIKYLLQLSARFDSRYAIPSNQHIPIAFITALFFSIHPMQVESVAWIAASKILLYSFLFLLSLIYYLRFIGNNKISGYLISIILFILSFGAKEQTIILPFCLVAIDYFLRRNLISKKVILEKLPYFLIALLLGLMSVRAQASGFKKIMDLYYYPLGQRMVFANFSLIKYLIKLVIPFKLSRFYPFPMASGKQVPLIYYIYPALVLVLLAFIYRFYKAGKRYIIFGSAFFIINLLLTLDIIPMARKTVNADRYIYLSCIGFFFVMAISGVNFFNKLSSGRQKIFIISICTYLCYLMAYTAIYTHNWK